MLVSAAGGARQVTRISEEVQETQVECCETIMRTEESSAPAPGATRAGARDVPRVAAVLRCRQGLGHREDAGHSLPNGLTAPLRC